MKTNYEATSNHLDSKTIIVGISLLIYTICSFVFQKINFHYIHESGICILLGAFISIYNYAFSTSDYNYNMFQFDEEIFFNLILPPIIFAAGYNLRKRAFFKYFSYSFVFGVLGTFIAFSFIVFLLVLFNHFNFFTLPFESGKPNLSLKVVEIMAFSAIIAATDTVAPLTFIKEEKKPKLFAILFGEGVLNDAVSIVLYKIINNMNKNNSNNSEDKFISLSTILSILGTFSYLFFLSLLLGAVGGLLCALILKIFKNYQPHRTHETTIIILIAFITYSTAELLHLSSVISLLFSGIFMSQYAYLNLSFQAREESCVVAKILSNFAEAFVFFYLGLSWMSVKASFISPAFIVICIIAILLGRTLVIFLLSFIVNSCPSLKMKIDFKEKTIMSFSGFIRGAISYGLAITIKTNDDQARNTLIVTVLIIVFFTTLIIGGILPFIMKKVNDEELNLANTFNSINSTSSSLSSSFVSSNYLSNDKANIETFSIQRFDKKEESNSSNINVDDNNEINLNNSFSQAGNKLKNFWSKFDQNYMKPCFIDDWPQVKNDHNEISTKIIELFELHQQKKLRNKEMSGIREKVNQRKEIMEKLREEKPFN